MRPDALNSSGDPTWVKVKGRAKTADGRAWTFDDESLTHDEAWELSTWLRDVAADNLVVGARIGFLEPNLELMWVEREQSNVVVVVWFSLECAPPWANGKAELALSLTPQALRSAADSWEHDLRNPPPPPYRPFPSC